MDQFNQQLGTRIKELRIKFKYSQEELADKLSIPRPSYGLIEKGARKISAQELVQISLIFNLSLSILVDFPKPEQSVSNSKELKVYFFRHGEAMDDIYNQYGGWADPELSAKGVNKAYTVVQKLKEKNICFDRVFTSPLKRAKTKAEIIARDLNSEVQVSQYLKERNTYGLLCGMNKDTAKHNFPELVEAYERGGFVLGSERYEDFVSRINLLFEYLRSYQPKAIGSVACVTHNKVMTAIIKEYLRMNPADLDEGCMLEIGLDQLSMHYIQSEGVTFNKSEN